MRVWSELFTSHDALCLLGFGLISMLHNMQCHLGVSLEVMNDVP